MSQTSKLAEDVAPRENQPRAGDTRKLSYSHNKVRKRLRRLMGQAIADYNMIEASDRIMVCPSSGKDAYTMLYILLKLQLSAPIVFEINAVKLDQTNTAFSAT